MWRVKKFLKQLHLLLLLSSRFSVEDDSSNLDEMPLMMSEEGFENEESDYQTLPRARLSQRRRGLCWLLLGGWKLLCGRYAVLLLRGGLVFDHALIPCTL